MNMSIADELLKLKNLLDAGVINQAEFDKQKSKLIHGEEKEFFTTLPTTKVAIPKKKITWKTVGWAFLGIVIVNLIIQKCERTNEPKTAKQLEEEKVQHREDSLQKIAHNYVKAREDTLLNAYVASRRFLKNSLNDPDSYDEIEHIETFELKRPKKGKPYINVEIRYRAKNGFGATVVSSHEFSYDSNLQMVKNVEN